MPCLRTLCFSAALHLADHALLYMAHCWPMVSMISLVASVCLLCSMKTLSPTLKPQHPFCLQLRVTAWHLQAVHPLLVVSSASDQYRQQGGRLLTENRFVKKRSYGKVVTQRVQECSKKTWLLSRFVETAKQLIHKWVIIGIRRHQHYLFRGEKKLSHRKQ